jgi:hypothetical protein
VGKRERPVVYRKDSERTHYRRQKYWKEASQGSANIGSFFTTKSLQLMPKSEMNVNIDDVTLQPNPAEEMAVELGLDVLDFCISQLEDDCTMIMSDTEVDENEFEVSAKIIVTRKSKLTNLGNRLLKSMQITPSQIPRPFRQSQLKLKLLANGSRLMMRTHQDQQISSQLLKDVCRMRRN